MGLFVLKEWKGNSSGDSEVNTKLAVWPLPSLVDEAQCTTTVRSLCHVIHGWGKVVGKWVCFKLH